MVEFKFNTPTIAQVYAYTYKNPHTYTRFFNEERDILKTRIKIIKRTVYKKNKEGKFTTPEERLYVASVSAPQYPPYNKVKSKGALKQRKIKHTYESVYLIQNTPNGYDFFRSQIIWRNGSFKKVPKTIPQSKVKQIHDDTREKLARKYAKYPKKQQSELIKRQISRIQKTARYISDSDYIAQVYGIMLDAYFRDYPLQVANSCLYGRCYFFKKPRDIKFCFFTKHDLGIIHMLLKRGILKYK